MQIWNLRNNDISTGVRRRRWTRSCGRSLPPWQNDADKITDAFYRDLEFGTAGLRGVLGAGTNRMNIYVIRRATQAVADYLNETDLPKTVAIGHDSRIKSDVFAREAAAVFAANGHHGVSLSPGSSRSRR